MNLARLAGLPAVLVVFVGLALLPPLSPSIDLLLVVPMLLAGIAILLAGLTSGGTGEEPTPAWTVLAVLGWSLVAAGVLGLLKLTPAGARTVLDGAEQLHDHCQGPASVRVDRDLLPLLESLDRSLAGQPESVRAVGASALSTTLPRCLAQLATALDEPEGTHGSWGMLRDWMVAHPEWVAVPEDLASKPLRPREHRPHRAPVSVDL